MKTFPRTIQSELIKIVSSRMWWVIFTLVVVVQPLFAIILAKSYAEIGLDATPETHPELVEAIPPLDYLGFEVVLFGLLPIVVFGGMLGASEYKYHELRTTLLCQSNRIQVFFSKVFALLICSTFLSFLSIIVTISIMHFSLGEEGLNPFSLSTVAWQFIGFSALDWILLTLLSFGMGMFFRNAIVPLVFLVPQVFNLGNFLAQKWEWGEYLPVAAGNLLFATPTDPLEHEPLKGGIILLVWVMLSLITSSVAFIRRDVGGKY
ncbi:ABC transporter permease [Metabacillus malikii]|uniref:ABC-type transport system involved in multi-copper enzyme maturation permease subunit n=1 Tax=Metabacillus malikii TaxID=1504265 RepID=A0ABT9ZLL7_9BACI|nr:ABC transporter permease [Metabacillus malikii]MDQ0232890.1 ABC-type transport system involved in multi-copper enzyme maturation permease subunit [Metabacillus malikii]